MNSLFEWRKSFYSFWSKNPALFLGLSILLGTALHFLPHPVLGILFAALCLTAKSKPLLLCSILCFASAFLFTQFRYPKIILPQEKVQGIGTFHIDQIKPYSSPFNRFLLYKGVLFNFEDAEGNTINEIPCNVYLPLFGKRPPANTDYAIRGTLCQKADRTFVLKPEKKSRWIPVSSRFNLSECRFNAKRAVFKYLKNEISHPHARTFLNALATGDVDERILSMEFGKIGLQHILAISGFHFAMAALFLHFLFRLLLPDKISLCALFAALCIYYLFLGNTPSIQRAYIAISLVILGKLFSLKISGLNALGAGLIVELVSAPICVTQLSFQLTFLCTLAILLFYPIASHWTTYLLPSRFYLEVQSMSLLDKHGYLLSSLLRKALAANLAVHFISIPVLLHMFHKFPLLSLAYNLFFPACVFLSMLLLFFALLLAPMLPFLSHAIHFLNNTWTSAILSLTTNAPAFLDFSIRSKAIPFTFIACFLAVSFFVGVLINQSLEKKEI